MWSRKSCLSDISMMVYAAVCDIMRKDLTAILRTEIIFILHHNNGEVRGICACMNLIGQYSDLADDVILQASKS